MITNEFFIRGAVQLRCLRNEVVKARLRWFGHVQKRKSEFNRRMFEDMKVVG